MVNSPIQIVLNSGDFVVDLERPKNISNTDFYFGRDAEFAIHKNKINSQLNSIKNSQLLNEFTTISFAKVSVKKEAVSKSHRPTGQIFKNNITPIVGGGELGEMFVELNPSSIDSLNNKISTAEYESRTKVNKITFKDEPNPSPLRSELGAIENIAAYDLFDKRNFSIAEGLKWISQLKTGGIYIVELFLIPPSKKDWDTLDIDHYKLFNSFEQGLRNIGAGIVVSRIFDTPSNTPMLSIRIENTLTPPNIQFVSTSVNLRDNQNDFNADESKHVLLINFLDAHPLVRKIMLPPIISQSQNETIKFIDGEKISLPSMVKGKAYPKVGIVDGGVSSFFGEWVIGRLNILNPLDMDEEHGTFISGLLIAGQSLNGSSVCTEDDGCQIVDIAMLPKNSALTKTYYSNIESFFHSLEYHVIELKSKYGVRVFNFSLNIEEHISSNTYSIAARYLDKIAEENDVIFVIAAGNITKKEHWREEWPSNSVDALKILAGSRNDTIKSPSESYRNISVAALNPPNLEKSIVFALSNYSCRGPKIRIGLKPDFAHFGGSGTVDSKLGYGLFSIKPDGNSTSGCGTSYAAPNVAKAIACLENGIEGEVSRETLTALSIHHAISPKIFENTALKKITKDLIGFGMPNNSEVVLNGDPHSITLVFATRIFQGKKMRFNFSWPSCLVKEGKCSGKVRLSIVSTPPFDYKYGDEFMRVNIDAYLRQMQDDEKNSYKGSHLKPIFFNDVNHIDKKRIKNYFTWSPTKVYEGLLKEKGKKSEWRIEVEYLGRDGEMLPKEGVPFTAILTISDPEKQQPVFTDMHKQLQAMGVKIYDIQIAARNTVRT